MALGTFQKVDPTAPPAPAAGLAATPAAATRTSPAAESGKATAAAVAPVAAAAPAEKQWYDRLSIRGYTQLRFNHLLDDELDGL